MQFTNIQTFSIALVNPKTKFKIIRFMVENKLTNSQQITSFWRSLARGSTLFSSFFNIWLSTLKKIKNKFLLKTLLENFLTKKFWLSFSKFDILDKNIWNFTHLKQKIFLSQMHEPFQSELYITNKTVQKIFKSFFFLYHTKTFNLNFFQEKFFFWEKKIWAIGLSNKLKLFLIQFFTFFLPTPTMLKKFLFQKISNLEKFSPLNSLLTFKNIFKGKRYFLFLSNKLTPLHFKNFLIQLGQEIELFDLFLFNEGNLVNYSLQGSFLGKQQQVFFVSTDQALIHFFLKHNVYISKSFMTGALSNWIKNLTLSSNNLYFKFFNYYFSFSFNDFLEFFFFFLKKILNFPLVCFKNFFFLNFYFINSLCQLSPNY